MSANLLHKALRKNALVVIHVNVTLLPPNGKNIHLTNNYTLSSKNNMCHKKKFPKECEFVNTILSSVVKVCALGAEDR